MKLSDVLCDEYEDPKTYPSEFYKKYKSKGKCLHYTLRTPALTDWVIKNGTAPYVCGVTKDSPTGEPYVKIHFIGKNIEECEGALLHLLDEYKRLSARAGKRYLFLRSEPIIRREGYSKWLGRARLLYSNGKVFKEKT
jgi:hypothetical protein